MCITAFPAELDDTILYGGIHQDATGLVTHHVGYVNTPINYWEGPNAMLLTFPSAQPMTGANIHDTRSAKRIFRDMQKSLEPPMRAVAKSFSLGGDFVIVDYDIYQIIMTTASGNIARALQQVSSNKRPDYNPYVFGYLKEKMPLLSVALCCFDSREAKEAAPMFFWYEPSDPDVFVLPALDAHTGYAPTPDPVDVNTWVILNADSMPRGKGHDVHYQDAIPQELAPYLPRTVVGKHYEQRMPNGDFVFPSRVFETGNLNTMARYMPEDY